MSLENCVFYGEPRTSEIFYEGGGGGRETGDLLFNGSDLTDRI